MPKIKVLQMPVRNAKGGITQYALRNWEHIDKSRFCFDWVTLDPELSFEDELVRQGCKVYHLSCRQEDNEARFRAEMEEIYANRYDAIHLHTSYWRGFLAEELAIKAKIPKILVHAHSTGIDSPNPDTREKLLAAHNAWKSRFSTELATHFLACSHAAAKWLYGPQIPEQRICVLNNAIEISKFSYNPRIREQFRHETGVTDHFVIGHIGRFEYQKNHDFLIDVFFEVSKEIPNAKLMLIGDGAELERIKSKAKRLGLSDKILFLGWRKDVAELYQAMDLFVLPSMFEGQAIVLVEAQTSGVKCISSTSSALPENTLTDNIFALPFDVEQWKHAVIDIARNGYERSDCSDEITAAGYSLKEQIKILENIYAGG